MLIAAVEKARQGEEVTITENGRPIAKIVGVESKRGVPQMGALKGLIEIADDFDAPLHLQPEQRGGFGAFKGQIWMSDDFNDPLPEEELREWEK